MSTRHTLVGCKIPQSLNRFEIQEIFGQFGKLYGDGLRFPSKKSDNRFFIDFQDRVSALKAYRSLNGKSHPKTNFGYKFDLKLLPSSQILSHNDFKLKIQLETQNNLITKSKISKLTLDNEKQITNKHPVNDNLSTKNESISSKSQIIATENENIEKSIKKQKKNKIHQSCTENYVSINKSKNKDDSLTSKDPVIQINKTQSNLDKTKNTNVSHYDDIIDLLNFSYSIPNSNEDFTSSDNLEIATNILINNIGGFKLNKKAQFGSYLIPTLPQLGPDNTVALDPSI